MPSNCGSNALSFKRVKGICGLSLPGTTCHRNRRSRGSSPPQVRHRACRRAGAGRPLDGMSFLAAVDRNLCNGRNGIGEAMAHGALDQFTTSVPQRGLSEKNIDPRGEREQGNVRPWKTIIVAALKVMPAVNGSAKAHRPPKTQKP